MALVAVSSSSGKQELASACAHARRPHASASRREEEDRGGGELGQLGRTAGPVGCIVPGQQVAQVSPGSSSFLFSFLFFF